MTDADRAAPHFTFGLGLLVFAGGACLMGVEIVGGLAIAPYFGSNVFVWGSVISVFMGALSLGYVLGGMVADTNPGGGTLSALTLAAGALVAVVPLIGPRLCRALLRADLGPGLNPLLPLVAVVLLYFLPTMLLGMISPVAVRIASAALTSVGRVTGKVYAVTTLGSVFGALLSTFVLVTFFGNRVILLGCGVVLVVVAFFCFYLNRGVVGGGPAGRARTPAGDAKPIPGLRPLVFACGMVLMSLEVIGGAAIAPFFGSSVFVWGSVITVFLGALSLGYVAGGKLADRRTTMMALATVVVAAGIATLVVPLVAPAVCKALMGTSSGGSNVLRPLFASLILYFVPITLFAMVAPFAVRLSTGRVGSVGGVAGRLYALSTLGNVVGVLLTTFVLISAIGKTHLFELGGVGAVLAAVLAVFIYNRAREGEDGGQPWLVSGLLALVVVALALVTKPDLVPLADQAEEVVGSAEGGWSVVKLKDAEYYVLRRIRAQRESPYHHLAVIEEKVLPVGEKFTTEEGKAFLVGQTDSMGNRRQLRFDQYVESAVLLDADAKKIRQPYASGTTYSDLLHLPFIFSAEVRNVLIVGGGGGVVPMIFRNSYPRLSIDVVEIDPVVVGMAKRWFGLRLDERLRMHVQDGRMFIHNSKTKYDLIILDAYTAGGRIPFHLTTKEFLTEVREHLTKRGVALMNVISAIEGRSSRLFRSEYKTFKAVFGREHIYIFPKMSDTNWDPETSRNIILIATGAAHRRRLPKSEIEDLAARLKAAGKIKMPTIDRHAANMLTRGELLVLPQDDVPLLTDDYAPVDMMIVD